MIGKTISHYRIVDKIGEGGMGVVYRAEDTKLGRYVALKFLSTDAAEGDAGLERFRAEARAAATLNQPNIATVHAIEDADGHTFICMEYIEGENLADRIASGPLDTDDVREIAIQVARGLAAAHDAGVIHRDVKSANIMIDKSGRARVMDFGVAKVRKSVALTRAGISSGTIAYMSPEQMQGTDVDHRADLWSLGVVMYEMLAGRRPFAADYDAALMYEVLNDDPPALDQFRDDVPASLSELIAQLLHKDPARRPADAREVIARLGERDQRRAERDNSIAVLYFENMSPDKENEYFCAGITEDLIIDLSRIHGVRVIPRSDVLPLRGKELNRQEIGRRLGVTHVLEGSVRKAANKIRITAQLVDVQTGFQKWADRYDRLFEDIFEIQADVSQKIAEAMRVSLTDSEKRVLEKKATTDIRAYDLYMRGREFVARGGHKNTLAAIGMFEGALKIDSNFALAHVALAEASAHQLMFYEGNTEWMTRLTEATEKAIELDPTMPEAQFGLGMLHYLRRDFDAALESFRTLLKVRPDFYPAIRWASITCSVLNDFDEAIRLGREGARVKPYSEEPWVHIGVSAHRAGNEAVAEEADRELMVRAHRKLELNPEDAIVWSRVASTIARRGDADEARSAVDRVAAIDPDDGLCLYNCACTCAILGERERALDFLRAAIDKGYGNTLDWVRADPDLVSLHEDPEFKKLVDAQNAR